LAALVVLGISWGLPSAGANSAVSNALGQSEISQTWRDFQDNWTRLFSSLRTYGIGTSDAFRSNLSLGGPRSVSSNLVMDVYVDEPLPYVYWKAVSYDTYEDGNWSISESDSYNYLPDEGEIPIASSRMRKEVSQTFVNYVPNAGMIYAAPELINADRPMVVNHSLDDTGNMVVNSAMSRRILRQGERYRVNSDYSIADASSLRLAPEEYPEWIRERYLQVPESITPETITLAEQLTAEADNPFDKAISVRDYLRKNIAYNDQIQAPPEGIEPIHHILFNDQEAYCNYYASSMVMMLRSQGVPARFVAGYTQGEWDEETRSYRVRARNSHAWVEVYFPGYGWIQFEPTASLPLGERPESTGNPGDAFKSRATVQDEQPLLDGLTEDLNPQEQPGQNEAAQNGQGDSSNRAWLIRTIIAVFITGLGFLTIYAARELNWRVESDIVRSYGRLGSWARWLGIVIRPAHTPHERASLLTKEVPEGRQSFYSLTDQYVRQRFSRKRSAIDGYDSTHQWHLVRPFLIRKTIYYQFKKLIKRPRWR
jgi:transglutaminase-like putative cysteine protease